MAYKFETLRVWQRALEYDDLVCRFAAALPDHERFALRSQIRRASMSIVLNIAEGSTSQTDGQKHKFLGYAIRSLVETVAAQHLAKRRGYRVDETLDVEMYELGERLFSELQAFRQTVRERLRRNRKRRH